MTKGRSCRCNGPMAICKSYRCARNKTNVCLVTPFRRRICENQEPGSLQNGPFLDNTRVQSIIILYIPLATRFTLCRSCFALLDDSRLVPLLSEFLKAPKSSCLRSLLDHRLRVELIWQLEETFPVGLHLVEETSGRKRQSSFAVLVQLKNCQSLFNMISKNQFYTNVSFFIESSFWFRVSVRTRLFYSIEL